MKKNISNLLQRGNLTPKQRYLLLIQADILEETTGKKSLTKADKEALINWQAKTNKEVREWNRYNNGWKLSERARIEAEFIYMETLAENYRKNIISTELSIYPFYREHLNTLQALKRIKVVDINEAIEITKKQREEKLKEGIDFDHAIYQLAFESLSDEIRKDILILDPEAEYESSYLDDEETIANLIDKKGELTKENKEKYAELVADRSYNEFAKEYQLWGSFASLPIIDIAKKWAKDKGIKPRKKDYERLEKIKSRVKKRGIKKEIEEVEKSDEEWLLEENLKEILEDYAKDNKTTIKAILKETLLKWLEEGLPYPSLVISEDKETYGEDTKLPHNEIFKEWLKAKKKAKETLQKLIDKGELKTDQTGQDKTITGESLYNFKGNYEFIKEFKERVDRYSANDGFVYADDDPEHKGDHLDRELLITEKDKDGKPAIFSLFNMSLRKIEEALRPRYFKEVEKNGETYLEFKSDDIKKAFKTTRQSLIDGYAKLLAFSEIFKKINKIYGAETDYLLKQRIKSVAEFMDQHNLYLENALQEDLAGFGGEFSIGFDLYEKPLKTKEDWTIKKDKIAPDAEIKRKWTEKFQEIFNEF